MTVGELVYRQAMDGYVPAIPLSDGFISVMARTAEESQKLVETLKEPMENMQKVMESVRPQLEAMSRIIPRVTTPFIPFLYEKEDEDFIVPALSRSVQEYVLEAPAPARQERILSSYILPGNGNWSLLEIRFLDGHTVRLSYPGLPSRKFTYTEMGFVNERTMGPDMKWKMLKEIADRGGSLTKANWNRRFHRNIKYELNEGLMRFFGMTESPIPRYTRSNGYTPLFVIRGDI